MNKDAIMATIIGFTIGLAITGVILFGPNVLKLMPSITLPNIANQTKPTSIPNDTPASASDSTFTLDSPLADAIVDTSTILVSGSAPSGSVLVIEGAHDEVISRASAEGKFAGKVTLAEGLNTIIVTNYNNKEEQNKKVTVYYTQESL